VRSMAGKPYFNQEAMLSLSSSTLTLTMVTLLCEVEYKQRLGVDLGVVAPASSFLLIAEVRMKKRNHPVAFML